jgi:hypothetical protein
MRKIIFFAVVVMAGVITVVWIGIAVYFAAVDCPNFLGLELNEKGDFLAGIFAPLVFLWFVLGYMQQAKEINRQASMQVFLHLEQRIREDLLECLKEIILSCKLTQLNGDFIPSETLFSACSGVLYYFIRVNSISNGSYGEVYSDVLLNMPISDPKDYVETRIFLESYCQLFDELIKKAQQADKSKVTAEYYLKSPAGKIKSQITIFLSNCYKMDGNGIIIPKEHPHGN